MKNDNVKNVIIGIAILIIFVIVYLLLSHFINKVPKEYDDYLKNYEVNEYIATYVTDEDMARIYLNDYIHNMYYDIERAYNLLDEEYRNKKFGSLENYKNYVYSLNYETYNLVKYYKTSRDGALVFGVYDNNGNFFAFKANGVMQYKVYLDDYTVEI